MVEYLALKNPQYYYNSIPVESLVTSGRWSSYGDYGLHEIAPYCFQTQEKSFLQRISLRLYLLSTIRFWKFLRISSVNGNPFFFLVENAVENGEDDADLNEPG